MPLLMGGSIAAQFFLKDKVDTTDKRIAVIDRTPGKLYEALSAAAEQRNEGREVFQGEGAGEAGQAAASLLETCRRRPGGRRRSSPRSALSERVRKEDLFGFRG